MNSMNVLAHNIPGMFANRQLNMSNTNRAKSSEKLSSGYKINRAADDAAGLTISEKLRHKVRSLNQGSDNIEDGVSLCQVADGALAETQDILQKINMLAIKSSNGTNTQEDRQAIQAEIAKLKEEINRIANSTSFNEKIQPLTGEYRTDSVPGGTITFEDIQMEKWGDTVTSMQKWPFTENDDPTTLKLIAEINGSSTIADGSQYNLYYSYGVNHNDYNYSSLLLGYKNAEDTDPTFANIHYSNMKVKPNSFSMDIDNQTVSRTLTYEDTKKNLSFEIDQSVTLDPTNKIYQIDSKFRNTGSASVDSYMFLQYFDTAYDNNDDVEHYFTNSSELQKESLFTDGFDSSFKNQIDALGDSKLSSKVSDWLSNGTNPGSLPDSMSIANTEKSLPFSSYIEFDHSKKGFLSVADFDGKDHLKFIQNYNTGSESGRKNLTGMDHTFTYATFGDSTIKFGIKDVYTDSNVPNDNIKLKDIDVKVKKEKTWIQYSDVKEDGMEIKMVDATLNGLGMERVDLSTKDGALAAIDTTKNAIDKVSAYRSQFGASQNRLEYAYKINQNTSENTDSAESLIRDTDMSKEILKFTKENILNQAGQSMFTQSNQSRESVLALLQ
ncbi:MAG: hypothetical protein K5931_01450 [Lachnospiraceae bacterium]|nr:hypothetical protein [Lachnospiraceae bacterium]